MKRPARTAMAEYNVSPSSSSQKYPKYICKIKGGQLKKNAIFVNAFFWRLTPTETIFDAKKMFP